MILQRYSLQTLPNIKVLSEMLKAMYNLLNSPRNSILTVDELLTFQDEDGSFKFLDTYQVESDFCVEFCYLPTYISAAILMREMLSGRNDLDSALERALNISTHRSLMGHGYDSTFGQIEAMLIFIKGGVKAFMERRKDICPEFHQMIYNILEGYKQCLISGKTSGTWGENYRGKMQAVVDRFDDKITYIAYGSNMDRKQMISRCPNAICLGTTFIEDWQLTMPFYANIEPKGGARTPALIWQLTREGEELMDVYEGYPNGYEKTDIDITINGHYVAAMAYIMTPKYKASGKKARDGYEEQIKCAYVNEGFSIEEYSPIYS